MRTSFVQYMLLAMALLIVSVVGGLVIRSTECRIVNIYPGGESCPEGEAWWTK